MNIKRILFPTDFSHYNDAALHFASTLAAESNAELIIVHVDDLRDLAAVMADSAYPFVDPSQIQDRSAVERQLNGVVPSLPEVKYRHRYLKGIPAVEIVEFAEREDVDLIVMASHGRSGMMRLLMGSIAEGVMRKAPCPVLVVKQPASHPIPVSEPDSPWMHG